jgi:hypothetical protein
MTVAATMTVDDSDNNGNDGGNDNNNGNGNNDDGNYYDGNEEIFLNVALAKAHRLRRLIAAKIKGCLFP